MSDTGIKNAGLSDEQAGVLAEILKKVEGIALKGVAIGTFIHY